MAILLGLLTVPGLFAQQAAEARLAEAQAILVEVAAEPPVDAEPAAAEEADTEEADAVVDEVPAVVEFAAPNGAANPAAKKAMIAQLIPQMRPLLRAELHFARIVCQPTAEQAATLAKEGEAGLEAAAEQVAGHQMQMQFGFRAGSEMTYPDPNRDITRTLLAAIEKHWTPEQAKRYRDELEHREKHRARLAILNYVARMDRELQLTAQQRKQVEQRLSQEWRDDWHRDLRYFTNGMPYLSFPTIDLTDILTPRQNSIWVAFPRNSHVYFGMEDFSNVVFVEAEDDDSAPAGAESPAEKEAPAAKEPAAEAADGSEQDASAADTENADKQP